MRQDYSVAGVGYNGAPSGVDIQWADRDFRRDLVIHAEVNALRYATLADMRGGSMAVTHVPCPKCLTVLSSYQIGWLVYRERLDPATYDHDLIERVAKSCRIKLVEVHL
jgi:deoxycytidylate deaminase